MKKTNIIILVITLVLGVYLGIDIITPPSVQSSQLHDDITLKDVQDEENVSLNMQLSHIKKMTVTAHPVGSKENKAVGQYLKEQVTEMGYNYKTHNFQLKFDDIYHPEVPRKDGSSDEEYKQRLKEKLNMKEDSVIDLENILVSKEVEGATNGVLIVSHYDSTAHGPGAADDIVSVASMLEVMRVEANKDAKNNLYFLFTDGEEAGLLGAHEFVKSNPNFKEQVDFVINLEARGNTGGVIMFQTSNQNQELVKQYVNGTNTGLAFSIAGEVYRSLPNGTDLSEFFDAGYQGMDFAAIEGARNYHTANDTLENLNKSTANQYLTTLSELVRYSANADLSSVKDNANYENAIYFPIIKGHMMLFSISTGKILALITVLLATILLVILLKTKKLNPKTFLKSIGVTFSGILITVLFSFLCSSVIGMLLSSNPSESKATVFLRWQGTYPAYYIIMLLTVLISIVFIFKAYKKEELKDVVYGMMPLLIILTLVTTFIFPVANYLFFIPLCLLTIYGLITLFMNKGNASKIVNYAFMVLIGIISLCLFIPMVYLVFVAMSFTMLYVCTLVFAIALMIIIPFAIAETKKQSE